MEGSGALQRVQFSRYGARIEVATDDPRFAAEVTRLFCGRGAETMEPPDVTYSFVVDAACAGPVLTRRSREGEGSESVELGRSGADVLSCFESDLHFQTALHARSVLFVHAGVVGWNRRAILLPGRSRSGKTSLVAALVRAGADYYSDEYAVVDPAGLVHPYAKPLSIRGGDGPAQPVPVLALGGRAGEEAIPTGLIVRTRYEPESVWRPRPMTRGEITLALLDNTVQAQLRPGECLQIMAAVAAGASGVEGPRGDATEVAAGILGLLASQ